MTDSFNKNEDAISISREADLELSRYISQTQEIRKLSVPQIRSIDRADTYRETLLENYVRIGELARGNGEILSRYFYPRFDFTGGLSPDEINTMRNFFCALTDASTITNLDISLAYKQAKRLVSEANRSGDDDLRVIALDEVVSASYIMIGMTERLVPASYVCLEYQKEGVEAAEQIIEYLDKDKFAALSEEAREMVIINARYIRAVSQIEGMPGDPETNALIIRRMKAAMELGKDPFYRDLLPNYDWDIHEFRILEYVASLTDYNNEKGYEGEDIRFINDCAKRLYELYTSRDPIYKNAHNTDSIEVYACRNAYLAGEITLVEYKEKLRHLSFKDDRKDLAEDVPLVMLYGPIEYLLLLDPDDLSEEDRVFLTRFYNRLIPYMHQTPKMGRLTFLLSYLTTILKCFIEVPDAADFETVGLNLIAALHPPTYVHTLCVADFTTCLTHHLLNRRPDLFVGMPGYESVEDVTKGAEDIERFARHAALCHDIGKLTITETIITYGRDLLEEEVGFIRVHPAIGSYILSKSQETREYADIACGHHKWFDDSKGYPMSFSVSDSKYRTIIGIVACADCLDAATDSVGRSYKKGKKLEELIREFEEGSGSRYSPHVVELFSDKEILAEINEILDRQRDKNYIETYRVLKNYDEK